MKRLCFVTQNLQMTRKLAKSLEHHGVSDSHVHVLGKRADRIANANLHQATLLQTTDLVPALKRGLLLSLVLMGFIFGVFYFTMPMGVTFSTKAVIAIVFGGFAFGIWASAMIGIGIPSKVVEATKTIVQEGHYIVMVDAPKEQVPDLVEHIAKEFPKVHLALPVEETSPLISRE